MVLIEVTNLWKGYIDKLNYHYSIADYSNNNFGIALLSKVPNTVLAIENIGNLGIASISMTGEINKIPFYLLAAHPPPPITALLSEHRNSQFKAMIEKLKTSKFTNKILVGDLNTTPWSNHFRELINLSGLYSNITLFQGTWPAILPIWMGIPIDHILLSPTIKLNNKRIFNAMGSDHRPIITELTITNCN